MKTHVPLTSLFLLISVGCSNSVEHTAKKIIVSHIACAESAERQQLLQSDESLTATQWSEVFAAGDFTQHFDHSGVEPTTIIVDSIKNILARRQNEEVAAGSSEFSVVAALLLECDASDISDADRQQLAELLHQSKLHDARQSAQLMQDAFIVVASSLQAIPLTPLVVADILCRPPCDTERSSRLLNFKNQVDLIASRRLQQISGKLDSSRQSTAGSECRPNRLIAGQ